MLCPNKRYRNLSRGVAGVEHEDTLYVERNNPTAHTSAVLKTMNYFQQTFTVFTNVEDFEVKNSYLFASQRVVSCVMNSSSISDFSYVLLFEDM